ncbi:putative phage tail protein [Methylobacterium fujisawaense]|uniref:putative phage tail protein n=1 Tax=Methylobacterium fujisawaense TaxID=107400 RepID=UPI0031F538CE
MSDVVAGWPCYGLPVDPPSVADVEAQPTADSLLPQILPLCPRGAAWGTDETGDGKGAAPVQRAFWRALAAFAAGHLGLDWQAATQTFPSAITYTLPDWEKEYGLPGPCASGAGGIPVRQAAVRAKFASFGGQSPGYFVCLAYSLGYEITIEEPTQFLCVESECVGDAIQETYFRCDDSVVGQDGDPIEGFILPTDAAAGDEVSDQTVWQYWVVHVGPTRETWFRCDEGECDYDPLEGFVPDEDLECALRAVEPQHTHLVFSYAAAA